MGKRPCPNAMLLPCRGGVFETLPFDGAGVADGFGGFDGRISDGFIRDVLGEKNLGHFGAVNSADSFDFEEQLGVLMSVVPHRVQV